MTTTRKPMEDQIISESAQDENPKPLDMNHNPLEHLPALEADPSDYDKPWNDYKILAPSGNNEQAAMLATFGSTNPTFVRKIIDRMKDLDPRLAQAEEHNQLDVLAKQHTELLAAAQTPEGLRALLASEMLATMKLADQAASITNQIHEGDYELRELTAKSTVRLKRLVLDQMKELQRLVGGHESHQKVTVQHVHLSGQAQAVVGGEIELPNGEPRPSTNSDHSPAKNHRG